MTTLNVSLPDSLRQFVEAQVEQGGYSTASEYIRYLIRGAREAAESARIERLMLEGIQSGPAVPLEAAEWKALRLSVAGQRSAYSPGTGSSASVPDGPVDEPGGE